MQSTQPNQKYFRVSSTDVHSRLDVSFYQYDPKDSYGDIKYPLTTIGEIVELIESGTTPPKSAYIQDEEEIPIIKAAAASGIIVDLSKRAYFHTEKTSLKTVKKDDIFILAAAHQPEYVGKNVSILLDEPERPTTYVGELIRIRVNRSKYLPKLLLFILLSDTGYSLLNRQKRGQTSHLYPKDLLDIPIPLIDLDTQERLVEELEKGHYFTNTSDIKENYDEVLSDLLNLNFTESKHSKKWFSISNTDIIKRIDPIFYSSDALVNIEKRPDARLLGDVCDYFKSGFAAGKSSQSDVGIIQVRPTNMINGELVFDKNVYLSEEYKYTRTDSLLKKGEVLFNNTNSQELVGKSVYFNLDGVYLCSNHITRIHCTKLVDPEYLTYILNLYQKMGIFYKICTNWNNQSGINIELLRLLSIPLPDLERQRGVVTKLNSMKEKTHSEHRAILQSKVHAVETVQQHIFGR